MALYNSQKMKELNNYDVTIYYKEPTFCKTIGKDPDTVFNGLFNINAKSQDVAIEKACSEFYTFIRLSNVNWERQIIDYKIKCNNIF